MRAIAAILTSAGLMMIQPVHAREPFRPRIVSVMEAVLSPDGKYLAVGQGGDTDEAIAGTMNLLSVNRVADGKQIWALAGHKKYAQELAFTSDNKYFLSCDGVNLIRLWNLGTGKQVREFKGPSEGRVASAFSADGKELLLYFRGRSSDNGVFKRYEVATGKLLQTISTGKVNVVSFTLSENGKWAFLRCDSTPEVSETSGPVGKKFPFRAQDMEKEKGDVFMPPGRTFPYRVLDIAKEKIVVSIDTLKEQSAGDACLTADNKFVILNRVKVEPAPEPGIWGAKTSYPTLWSIAQQKEVCCFPARGKFALPLYVDRTPDGKSLLSRDSDNRIRLWDMERGKELWNVEAKEGWGVLGRNKSITILPGGKQFAFLSGEPLNAFAWCWTVKTYRLADGKLLRTDKVTVSLR